MKRVYPDKEKTKELYISLAEYLNRLPKRGKFSAMDIFMKCKNDNVILMLCTLESGKYITEMKGPRNEGRVLKEIPTDEKFVEHIISEIYRFGKDIPSFPH